MFNNVFSQCLMDVCQCGFLCALPDSDHWPPSARVVYWVAGRSTFVFSFVFFCMFLISSFLFVCGREEKCVFRSSFDLGCVVSGQKVNTPFFLLFGFNVCFYSSLVCSKVFFFFSLLIFELLHCPESSVEWAKVNIPFSCICF